MSPDIHRELFICRVGTSSDVRFHASESHQNSHVSFDQSNNASRDAKMHFQCGATAALTATSVLDRFKNPAANYQKFYQEH